MKPIRSHLFPRLAISFCHLVLAISAPLHADTIYWDGSTNSSWGTSTNWSTSSTSGTPDPAAAPGSADIATFSITGLTYPRTINLDGSQSVSGISTTGQTGVALLRGGGALPSTLTIGSDGINHTRGGLTIGTASDDKVNILLSGSQTWTSSTTGSGTLQALQIINDVSAAGPGSQTLTLDGINTGSFIRGNISNGAGSVSIVKNGTGIWELQGTNTYTGTTAVNAGNLRLANLVSASPGTTFNVADGAILSLKTANSGGTTGFTSAQISSFVSGVNFTSNAAILGLDTGNGTFTHTGNLSGNHGLTKLGGNNLVLSGTNTHTGATFIAEGGLVMSNVAAISTGSAITVNSGAYLIASSTLTQPQMDALRTSATYVDGTAAFGIDTTSGNFTYSNAIDWTHGFAKTGGNTLTLGGTASNTHTGLTIVAGGTLDLGKTGGATAIAGDVRINSGTLLLTQNNQIADTSNVNVAGGTLNFSGRTETINALSISGGGTVSTGVGNINTGAITRSGNTSKITVNSGGRLSATSLSLTGDNIGINAADGGNILMGGGSTSVITELEIGAGGLSMTGQTIQVNNTAATNKGTRITLNGNFTGTGTNIIGLNGATSSLAELAMGTGTRTFTTNSTGSGGTTVLGDTEIGLNITGENLTKAGAGTLTLKGNNTYTGVTQVNNGVIRVLSNTGLGSNAGGTVAAGGAVRLENNVTVSGESLTIVGSTSGSTNNAGLVNFSGNNIWTGGVTLDVSNGQNTRISMTDGTLDIQGNILIDSGATATTSVGLVLTGNGGIGKISGNISGVGSSQTLIKNGNSTWELTGTNTYSGTSRVDAGVLIASSIANNLGSPAAGNSAIHLGEALTTGTLRYTGTGESTTRGLYLRSNETANAGGGVIEQAGTGALIISGGVTGNTTTSDKTLTLQGSTSGTGELSGSFADTGGTGKTHLVKTGTGTWFLTGSAKGYEGTTTVTGGILNVSTSLTQSTSLSVSDGTFVIGANNVLKDDATVTLGSGAILQVANFTDSTGVLAVTGNAQLQLIGGSNSLIFANSSSADWTGGTLAVSGWSGLEAGDDQIIFEGGAGGLTTNQLASVTFVNPTGFALGVYSAKFDGTQLVPDALIPEPSSALIFLVGGAGLLGRRRRNTKGGETVSL